jgi:hypothetical protein
LRILEIASGTKNVVLDQEYKGYQSGGGGNGLGPYFIHAQFAAVVLKPGLYRVRVESLGNMPVLNAIPIFLHIGYYPNSTPISK